MDLEKSVLKIHLLWSGKNDLMETPFDHHTNNPAI